MMGYEFINDVPRFCLWLVNAEPNEIRRSKFITEHINAVREFRLASKKEATRRSADTPTLFQDVRQIKSSDCIVVIPVVSSGERRYIPIGYIDGNVIAGNKLFVIPDATLYHLGILTSNVHMAWMRAVCGRLKSDYSYSAKVVYNNFPWPSPTDKQRERITATAQAILDARAAHPNATLADLYDETTMPPALRKAHQANDRAVMAAYGFDIKITEGDCIAELMRMYQYLQDCNHPKEKMKQ